MGLILGDEKRGHVHGHASGGGGLLDPEAGGGQVAIVTIPSLPDAVTSRIPELDPPWVRTPVDGLLHYLFGDGSPRKRRYLDIDTSRAGITDFPGVRELLRTARPGTYDVHDIAACNTRD